MNDETNRLHNIKYKIAMSIGRSVDAKEALDYALTTYMSSLNLAATIVYEKQDDQFIVNTSANIQDDETASALIDEIRQNYTDIQKIYFEQGKPFVNTIAQTNYYTYELPNFGLLLNIKQGKPLSKYVQDSLIDIHDKLTVSIITAKNSAKLKELQEENISLSESKEQIVRQQSTHAQMGEMISMIAHQWRQPLAAISSTTADIQLNLILGTHDLEEESGREEFKTVLTEKLENISEFSQFLSATIDDFRDFFKPDRDKQIINIEEVVGKVLAITESTLRASYIDIQTEFNSTNNIETYTNEVMQVILNVIKNSRDNFVEKKIPNALITVTSKDIGNKIQIDICDNGRGIPKNIIGKIFDPYFSTKSDKDGTGLGLYMSKTIIEDHCRGTLEAKNSESGVCFSIVL